MKILGIDQSYTSTGWSIIDEDEEFLNFGVIKTTNEDGDVFTRARLITNKLKDIAVINGVNLVGIEGLAFGGFGNATRDLAGLQFLIVDSFRPTKIEIIAPTSVKKLAVGKHKGKIEKKDLYNSLPQNIKDILVNKGFKKSSGLYDITDSYWIAVYTYRNAVITRTQAKEPAP